MKYNISFVLLVAAVITVLISVANFQYSTLNRVLGSIIGLLLGTLSYYLFDTDEKEEGIKELKNKNDIAWDANREYCRLLDENNESNEVIHRQIIDLAETFEPLKKAEIKVRDYIFHETGINAVYPFEYLIESHKKLVERLNRV